MSPHVTKDCVERDVYLLLNGWLVHATNQTNPFFGCVAGVKIEPRYKIHTMPLEYCFGYLKVVDIETLNLTVVSESIIPILYFLFTLAGACPVILIGQEAPHDPADGI